MTNTKHTPGPWRATVGGEVRATMMGHDVQVAIATVHAPGISEQTSADARLIAAAPDLLAALPGRPLAIFLAAAAVAGLATVFAGSSRGRDRIAFLGSSSFLAGLSMATAACVFPVMLRSTSDAALSFTAHNGLGTAPITVYGTEELKKKWLPRVSQGKDKLACLALTEPDAGSDAAARRPGR